VPVKYNFTVYGAIDRQKNCCVTLLEAHAESNMAECFDNDVTVGEGQPANASV
jgi:hypothetical protein